MKQLIFNSHHRSTICKGEKLSFGGFKKPENFVLVHFPSEKLMLMTNVENSQYLLNIEENTTKKLKPVPKLHDTVLSPFTSKQNGRNFLRELFFNFRCIFFNIQQILAIFNVHHQHKFFRRKMYKDKILRLFKPTKRKLFAFADCWSMVGVEKLLGSKGPPLWFMPSLKHLLMEQHTSHLETHHPSSRALLLPITPGLVHTLNN